MPGEPQTAKTEGLFNTFLRGAPISGDGRVEMVTDARAELAALLAQNARLRRAAEGIDTFAWSSMKADCEEARVEGMKRIGAVRAALAESPG